MTAQLIVPAILRLICSHRSGIVRRLLRLRRATHRGHSISHQSILQLILQDVREDLCIETTRLIASCSSYIQITHARCEVHCELWQQFEEIEFLFSLEWYWHLALNNHTRAHSTHIHLVAQLRIVVILHLRRLIIQTQSRSETPTISRTKRRLMVESQAVGRQTEVAVNIKHIAVKRQHRLHAGWHIAQDKRLHAILKNIHRGIHLNLLIETVGSRHPLPAARLVVGTQHHILGEGVFVLLLLESKD